MSPTWNKENVVGRILELHQNGQRLNSLHVQTHNRALYCAACLYCGGWKQAIEGAGLDYDEVRIRERKRPVWSKEKIIAIIQERQRNGKPLNSHHICTKERRLYGAARNCFGGWSEAIAAAGLDYNHVRQRTLRRWTKNLIIQEIVRRSVQGLSIRGGDVAIEDQGLYHAAHRHLGEQGWSKARILAGFDPIDPSPHTIWNELTVVQEIRRLQDNGAALNVAALQKNHWRILAAGNKVFGSWKNAVAAAGLDYSKIRTKCPAGWWTKSRILETIKGLEQDGVRLSSKTIQSSCGDLYASAVKVFGSWSQAVEAAGINYQKHCRIWSTKAWLRKMTDAEYKEKTT